MNSRATSALILLTTAASGCATLTGRQAESPYAGTFVQRFTIVDGLSYPYQVFVPHNPRGERLPTILFLHGAGERGNDGVRQTTVGLGPVVKARAADFPAIVVMPQSPAESVWTGAPARAAARALDEATAEFGGDRDRTYLTGISMGGYGSWQLGLDHPGRFAAIVPVCGGIQPVPALPRIRVTGLPPAPADPYAAAAARLGTTPIWMFHGGADRVVLTAESRSMNAALRATGSTARYTEYEGVGHNSWDRAYAEPELWSWLFEQRRTR
jgi:predicted peptidase